MPNTRFSRMSKSILAALTLSLLALGAFPPAAAAAEGPSPKPKDVTAFAEALASSLRFPANAPFEPFLPVPPPAPAPVAAQWPTDVHGYDISWPQCGGTYPQGPVGYAVIGMTDGQAFEVQRCLKEQWDWAAQYGVSGYININSLKAAELQKWGRTGPYGDCSSTDWGCLSRNAGYAEADWALDRSKELGIELPPTVWLDIETLNYWTTDQAANRWLIEGAIAGVRDHGVDVGIYTTKNMWREITGDWDPDVPTWRPVGETSRAKAEASCNEPLAGETPFMAQWVEGNFDHNVLCPTGKDARDFFLVR